MGVERFNKKGAQLGLELAWFGLVWFVAATLGVFTESQRL